MNLGNGHSETPMHVHECHSQFVDVQTIPQTHIYQTKI